MNSEEKARLWTEFMAARKEFPRSMLLMEHFNAGTITRICDCGCNSYDIKVPNDFGLAPLLPAKEHGRGGCVLSMAFKLSGRDDCLEFDVFADAHGYLAGIDVSCNANSAPVPDKPRVVEPPYHVHGSLAQAP
jgi:hypothetical protein